MIHPARGPRALAQVAYDDPKPAGHRRILPKNPRLTDRYVDLGVIGAGICGEVRKIAATHNGQVFAMKKSKPSLLHLSRREVHIMRDLQHPHIVRLFDYQEYDDHSAILMEYVPEGSLGDYVETAGGTLDEGIVKVLTLQILQALSYLHHSCIIHRDVKPDNILLRSKNPFHFQLCDFGILTAMTKLDTAGLTFCGTPEYAAPEVYPPMITTIRGREKGQPKNLVIEPNTTPPRTYGHLRLRFGTL